MGAIVGFVRFRINEKESAEVCLRRGINHLSHRGPRGRLKTLKTYISHCGRIGIGELSSDPADDNALTLMGPLDSRWHSCVDGKIFQIKALDKLNSNWCGVTATHFLDGEYAWLAYHPLQHLFRAARDLVGVKPLYVYQDEFQIVFCSEIKGFFAFNDLNMERDIEHIQNKLKSQPVSPQSTSIKRVRSLLPGEILEVDIIEEKVKSLLPRIEATPRRLSVREAHEEFRELLKTAIKKRVGWQTEWGLLLSGGAASHLVLSIGIDSHLVDRWKTLSVEFEFLKSTRHILETLAARKQAAIYKSDHIEAHATEPSDIDGPLRHFDEFQPESGFITRHALYSKASQVFKSAIVGDGFYEIFGLNSSVPDKTPERFSSTQRQSKAESWMSSKFHHFFPKKIRDPRLTFERVLLSCDRMSGFNGLQVSSPFFDQDLVAFMKSLPPGRFRSDLLKQIIGDKPKDQRLRLQFPIELALGARVQGEDFRELRRLGVKLPNWGRRNAPKNPLFYKYYAMESHLKQLEIAKGLSGWRPSPKVFDLFFSP